MNKIDELKIKVEFINDLMGNTDGYKFLGKCKEYFSDNPVLIALLKTINAEIKELESNQPELDEDGIPYCKRKKSYPDWAKYEATDEGGDCYIYEVKPCSTFGVCNDRWLLDKSVDFDPRYKRIKTKKPPKDWTKTLRRIRDKE